MPRPTFRPPTETEINEARGYTAAIINAIPPRYRPLAWGVFGLLLLAATVLFVPVHTNTRPAYLATAVLADGSDVNLHVYADGSAAVERPTYDRAGHAAPPSWVAKIGPFNALPAAPAMGWGVTFMGDVAAKRRPLRYCLQERRDYDSRTGSATAAGGEQAIRAVFDDTFDILASVEDCGQADLVLGANAESDCGSADAWGCAALQYAGARPFIRVTFNGAALNRTMPPTCVRAIDWHELKHAGDLGHTGAYGGEGKAHPHPSDLGYIDGATCHPVDNPGERPALDDWQDGNGNRWGLRPASARKPRRQLPQARWLVQLWDDGGTGTGQWNIRPLAESSEDVPFTRWFVLIVTAPDGSQHYSTFIEVP